MFIERQLIDADSIYFRAAMASQKKKDIRQVIDYKMREITQNTGALETYVAIKGKENFRKDLYPAYKKNRPDLDEKIKEALNYGHNYMVDKYDAQLAHGMEADDLVSIWAYECRSTDNDYVVVGIDKDLLQIPGWHLNFIKMDAQYIDEDMANYKLMLQCLTGDTSDNIPGIRGIGPKKAERILHGVPMQRRWNRVRAAWRTHKAGNPTTSWRLLKMLETFEELDGIKSEIASQTNKRKQNVRDEEQAQDS